MHWIPDDLREFLSLRPVISPVHRGHQLQRTPSPFPSDPSPLLSTRSKTRQKQRLTTSLTDNGFYDTISSINIPSGQTCVLFKYVWSSCFSTAPILCIHITYESLHDSSSWFMDKNKLSNRVISIAPSMLYHANWPVEKRRTLQRPPGGKDLPGPLCH